VNLITPTDFENMSRKERCELLARLRMVKPRKQRNYKQEIDEYQRTQLIVELKVRGFQGSDDEINLLLCGGSLNSGAGMRIFYRNERLQEDDSWRKWSTIP
jgi:hypothetical protein